MRRSLALSCIAGILASGLSAPVAAQATDPPRLVLDESVWVTFYDLPSRRFRGIRDAFLKRDFESVERDLEASISFIRVEAGRAAPELVPGFDNIVRQLEAARRGVGQDAYTASQLDSIFAQSHWVLAQHYLVLAMQSREQGRHRNAGSYLYATAHHLERAVLWSDAKITRDVVKSLDSIRDMATRLANGENPDRIYSERPIRLTARTLTAIGEHIDRRVRIASLLPE